MKKIILFFLIFFLIYGLAELTQKIFPFFLSNLFEKNLEIENQNNSNVMLKFNKCEIPSIEYIPDRSTVVIGHAYGSPSGSEKKFISDKVMFFLENESNISNVIFTGDVFKNPSLKKWRKLDNIFENKFNIFIAPGNHDFYKPISRVYFLLSPFGFSKYPKEIDFKNIKIIIDDSISNQWEVNKAVIDNINKSKKDSIIIARHNVPIVELKDNSNSLEGISKKLDSFKSLKNKLSSKKIIWIIGDGMSIDCFEKDNHMFIVNGISGLNKDTVIIIHETNVYRYSIG